MVCLSDIDSRVEDRSQCWRQSGVNKVIDVDFRPVLWWSLDMGAPPAMPTRKEPDYLLVNSHAIQRPDIDPEHIYLHRVSMSVRVWESLMNHASDPRQQSQTMRVFPMIALP